MKLQKPKGTQDILPQESVKWQYVEEFARKTFKKYHYAEIRTPLFEHYEVNNCLIIMTKATVISQYAQKEQHQLCVLMWKINSLPQKSKSR